MYVSHVPAYGKSVCLAQYMLESIACISTAKGIRQVRHTVAIGYRFCPDTVESLSVAGVLHGEVSTDTCHILVIVVQAQVHSQSQHLAVVGAHGYSLLSDGSDDVIRYVAIVEACICTQGMRIIESMLIAQVQIHVVALLRAKGGIAILIIAITKELTVGRQTIGSLIRQLYL